MNIKNSAKDLLVVGLGGGSIIGIIIFLVILGPMLLLWAVNSIAESGGSNFYIEHNAWNYWVALVLLILVRGGKGG